jgi:uncharacterized protein (UPF0333 family)
MKKITLGVLITLSSILFTGCAMEPLTPEEFNKTVADKSIATAFWKYYDKGSNSSNRHTSNALYINQRLSNFSPIQAKVGNAYNFAQEKSENSEIYETYKNYVLSKGNKLGIYTGAFNAKMMKVKLNINNLPKINDDKLYFFDAAPLYAEFDKDNNLISIVISYHENYVAFNHFNNPSAPVEVNLKTELFFGQNIIKFRNAISKKEWNDNLINMVDSTTK